MSITLPLVSLTGLNVGQGGMILLQNLAVSANPAFTENKGTLRFLNDSGAGLLVSFGISSNQFYLGAGAWQDSPVAPGESQVNFTVTYIIPTNVTLPNVLQVTYYAPNEQVPSMGTLGNSPIGISGNVNVSTAQSVQNDGNLVGTQWQESTPAGAASSTWSVDNAGNFFVKGDNAGVLTLLLQTIAGATPLLKLLGGILIDSSGHIIVPNAESYSALNTDGVTREGMLQLNNLNQTTLFANSGVINFDAYANFDSNGVLHLVGAVQTKNGTQSGTATLIELLAGGFKIVVIIFSNYEEDTTQQALALKNTFAGPAFTLSLGAPDVLFASSGSHNHILTALASTGGTLTTTSSVPKNSLGSMDTTVTQINFPATLSTTVFNGVFLAGGV